jgi:hypothetical protein
MRKFSAVMREQRCATIMQQGQCFVGVRDELLFQNVRKSQFHPVFLPVHG